MRRRFSPSRAAPGWTTSANPFFKSSWSHCESGASRRCLASRLMGISSRHRAGALAEPQPLRSLNRRAVRRSSAVPSDDWCDDSFDIDFVVLRIVVGLCEWSSCLPETGERTEESPFKVFHVEQSVPSLQTAQGRAGEWVGSDVVVRELPARDASATPAFASPPHLSPRPGIFTRPRLPESSVSMSCGRFWRNQLFGRRRLASPSNSLRVEDCSRPTRPTKISARA